MTDYKLVPMEPTEAMIKAAEEAYMPFGDMELALRMAILAAPDVQGELVGWQFYKHGKWWNGDILTKDQRKNIEKEGVRVRNVYAAPQPSTDVAGLVESVWMYKGNDGEWKPFMNEQHRLNTLADGGWDVREFFTTSCQENLQPAERHPAPDVSELVEALEEARETIAAALRANAPDYFTTDADIARHVVIQRIDTALAAYRKGGEV